MGNCGNKTSSACTIKIRADTEIKGGGLGGGMLQDLPGKIDAETSRKKLAET